MLALSRRRSYSSRSAQRCWFDDLPEDVLILICSQCRIDEILKLRLTSKKIRNLISQYIATIAPASARSTFPRAQILLKPLEDRSLYTLHWLKGLIPQQLAAILVDRHRFSHEWTPERYGIPAEDDYGNDLRARVTNGFYALRHLSNISQQVYNMDEKDIVERTKTSRARKLIQPSKHDFELFRRREDMILKQRLEYIEGMSCQMARDYKLMFMLLSSVFRTSLSNHGTDYAPWIFDWGCGIDGQRLLRRGNSWLTWFVLHEGPDLFWNQWWSFDPTDHKTSNYIRDRSIESWFGKSKMTPEDFIRQFLPKEWNDINEKWHGVQRDYAFRVQKAMQDKAVSSTYDFTAVNPIMYFTQYVEVRQSREACGAPPIVETLSHVPFHIDFRCPEELFQKFCALREERAFLLPSQPRAESR
ncbi:hypothetical protein BDV96DRAFT_596287 [Lophiotrema nucula]|uniref:F-box domain-containing protein n=1 Tax=Lophiotrema nucula TaxID=690887 RepID=A0A6A5ZIZ1_9PLEO|nr:hypothetical protein BDV96DRAFT_596287 [Lophiotrema nucula]